MASHQRKKVHQIVGQAGKILPFKVSISVRSVCNLMYNLEDQLKQAHHWASFIIGRANNNLNNWFICPFALSLFIKKLIKLINNNSEMSPK